MSSRISAITANWSRSRSPISCRRTKIEAVFNVPAVSPATVTSVKSTSGSFRTAAATRLARTSVAARLVPSGARIVMSNCEVSSCGVKVTAVNWNSGMLERSTTRVPAATIPRWAMLHRSIRA